MHFRNRITHRIVKNGMEDAFSIRSLRDGPRDPVWWADTCYLVHTLSDGDLSGLKDALIRIGEGEVAVVVAGRETALSELCGRLVHLGYMLPDVCSDDESPPEDPPARLEAFQVTRSGIDHIPLFLTRQQAQVGLHGGNLEPIEEFAGNFLGMNEHHRSLPAEALIRFRQVLTSRDHTIDIEPDSDQEELLRVYETLGILEATAPFSWKPSLEATMNAPFLIDILLHQPRQNPDWETADPPSGDAG